MLLALTFLAGVVALAAVGMAFVRAHWGPHLGNHRSLPQRRHSERWGYRYVERPALDRPSRQSSQRSSGRADSSSRLRRSHDLQQARRWLWWPASAP